MCQTWVNKILLSCLDESQDGGNASAAFLIRKLDLTSTKDFFFCLDVLKSPDFHFAALCQVQRGFISSVFTFEDQWLSCVLLCDSKQTKRLTITTDETIFPERCTLAISPVSPRGVNIQVQASSKWFVLVVLIKTEDGAVCKREAVIGLSLFRSCRETVPKFKTAPGNNLSGLKAEKIFLLPQKWLFWSTRLF